MNERVNPSVARPVISQSAGVTVRRVGVNLGAEISGVDLRQTLSRRLENSQPAQLTGWPSFRSSHACRSGSVERRHWD